jgi:hypothetical protein
MAWRSLEVSVNQIEQRPGYLEPRRGFAQRGLDMSFGDQGHQAIERTAAAGDLLHELIARYTGLNGALEGRYLPMDTADATEHLCRRFDLTCHCLSSGVEPAIGSTKDTS